MPAEVGGQLSAIDNRRSDLADDDPGRRVRQAGSIGQVEAGCERRRHRGHRCVSSSRYVVDLAHFGPLDMDRAIGRDQNHPLGTERGQDGGEAAALDQRARASTTSLSVATAMPVASASSRRLGFSRSAPR